MIRSLSASTKSTNKTKHSEKKQQKGVVTQVPLSGLLLLAVHLDAVLVLPVVRVAVLQDRGNAHTTGAHFSTNGNGNGNFRGDDGKTVHRLDLKIGQVG